MTTAFLADPFAVRHNPGPGHVEQPARWEAAVAGVGRQRLTPSAPRAALFDELALCHTPEYIGVAQRDVERGAAQLSTGDTDVSKESYEVALHGAGVCLNAVDMVMRGEAGKAFCVVRPPGHHATADRGMGFCLFNNIAIAARYAQQRYGVERVAIADWDVHHGNGTQDIFYEDATVHFFSTHQSPWYPGTGAANETGQGAGERTTLNCPFGAGAGREEILGVFSKQWLPRIEEFRPDLILISAGFDSRLGDPLGQFRLTDEDFTELTRIVLEAAEKHSQGRVISVLEGGYSLGGLTSGVNAHTRALAGDTF